MHIIYGGSSTRSLPLNLVVLTRSLPLTRPLSLPVYVATSQHAPLSIFGGCWRSVSPIPFLQTQLFYRLVSLFWIKSRAAACRKARLRN